jgi:putative serine protease PepD
LRIRLVSPASDFSVWLHKLFRLGCDSVRSKSSLKGLEMSDYNRQFVFEVPIESVLTPKQTLRQRMTKRLTFLTGVSALTIGAVVGAGVGAGVGVATYNYWTRPAPVVVNDTQAVNWVTASAAKASPSVVTISVSGASSAGNGSGVFLTSDGYIVTNSHVVTMDGTASKVQIEVKTYDGHIYTGTVVGKDPINDIAVVKVEAGNIFTPMKFADSDRLNVGQSVVAIGAPLGLASTVTNGIVSALNRTIQVASSAVPDSSGNGGGLQLFSGQGQSVSLRVIQTDAAINPGNSGGALVNEKGELIGINVAIASAGSGAAAGSIGVGFAIPSNTAKNIANQIIKTGSASHGLLGAAVQDATAAKSAAAFSVGAEVVQLTAGGAAEKAGVKVGDVITKFNGSEITSASELTAAVREEPAGAKVSFELKRGDQTLTLNATLGDAATLK